MLTVSLSIVVFTVLTVLLISIKQANEVQKNKDSISHTEKVLLMATEIEFLSSKNILIARELLNTGKAAYAQLYDREQDRLQRVVDELKQSETTDEIQQASIDSVQQYVQQLTGYSVRLNKVVRMTDSGDEKKRAADQVKREFSVILELLEKYTGLIREAEKKERAAQQMASEKALNYLKIILYSFLGFVLLMGVVLFRAIRKEVARHYSTEKKFSTLLEAAPDATIISNDAGIITMANIAAVNLFGYAKKELEGMKVEQLIPEDKRVAHVKAREKFSLKPDPRGMEAAGMDMQALHKDGTLIPVEISLAPIETAEGRFIAAAIRNITQRKKSQEEIRQLFTQINQATEAIFVTDENLLITAWNHGAELLYGYSREEAIGQKSLALLKTQLTGEQVSQVLKEIDTNGFWVADVKRIKKDGSLLDVQTSHSVIRNDAGAITGYVAVSHDISVEKKLKARLHYLATITNQMSEAVLSRKLGDHRLISWNEGAVRLFGYKPEEAIGKSVNELGIVELRNEEFREIEQELLLNGIWKSEKVFTRKEGPSFTGAISASLVQGENDPDKYLVFLIKDETIEKTLQQTLRNQKEQLEKEVETRVGQIQQSEQQYRYLFENNPMPMWVFDLETFQFLDVNEMAIVKYGYTREEFLQMNLTDIRPESEKARFKSFDHAWRVSSTEANRGVWKHCRKNGIEIDVEVFAHSIMFHGRKARLVLLNDVTGRIRSEKELVASEKKFRALIENNNDIITLFDAGGKIIYRSPSAERVMGWSNDDLETLSFIDDIVHPQDRKRISELRQDVLKNPGVPFQTYYRGMHKDGHYVYLEGTLINLLHRNFVQAIVFNIRDVTVQKKAEEKLLAREKRFRSLIENSFDIIVLLDEQFKVIYRSPSAVRVTGRTDSDVFGKDPREHVHPDDIAELGKGIRKLLSAPGNTEHALFRHLKADGHYVWMEGYATNLLHDESVNAIVFNYRDVSERINAEDKLKASEERYRLTLDNMMEGVQIIGSDLTFKYVNKALAAQLRTPREELTGARLVDKLPGFEQSPLFNLIRRCFEERVPFQEESLLLLPDATKIWVRFSVQPVPEGVFVLTEDITEKMKAAEALKEEQQKLDAIANSSPGLIYSFQMSPDGNFSFPYASNALEELFGLTHEQIKHNITYLLDSTVKEDQALFINSIYESANSLQPWNLEFRYHHPEKGVIWLEGNSIPKKAKDGSITWHGIIMDVTERKMAENAIRENEEKYRTVVDQAFDGILFYNIEGEIVDCNNSASLTIGYSREELLKMNIAELFYPEDLSMRPLNIPSVITDGQIFDFRTMRRKDGTSVEIELVTRILPDGRFIAMGRDITAQNKSLSQQSLLSSIVNYSDDAIVSTNLEGVITSWNKGAEKIYGYTTEEMVGQNINRLSPLENMIDGEDVIAKLLKGETIQHYETERMRKDGTVISVSISASPLYNKDEINGVSKIVRDISRQKADEQRIRVSNDRYEAVARATSDAIWDFDYLTGKTFIAGTGYKFLFGYNMVNEFSEADFWESRLHPDDKERVIAAMDAAKQDKSISQSSVEYRFRKADGTYAYVNDRFFILRNKEGQSLRLLGAKQDITLRKEAEEELHRNFVEKQLLLERLSVILNTLPASVALLDTRGVVVEVNEAWKVFSDVNGFSDANYGIGTSYLTNSTQSFGDNEKDGKTISEGISDILAGRSSQFEYEYSWHLTKLNRWFRIVVTPLKGMEFAGAVVMNMDISEIKRLEQERIESRIEEQKKITEAMLRGQEKERNAIGIELHDNVNQILVGTKVLLSVVRDFPEKNPELLPSCIENISMAIQENRKIAHELVTPNLSAETLLQQITRLSDTMLKNAGISTYINSESFNENLLSNEMKLALYRVAQEQCTNIIKYAEAGQVIISLATKREMFIMRLADDGKGGDLNKVTHGIGLKNISSRLSVFGGTINIDTAPGQGFALEIEIPLFGEKQTQEEES